MTNQDFNIRLANQRMLSEVHSFLQSVFSPPFYGVLSWSLKELEERVSRANCDIVCIFAQGELVTSLLVEWHDEYMWADLFGIHHAYRGRGIPGKILAWLEEECRKRGIARIEFQTLDCLPRLHRFYERLGFIRGESFTPSGEILRYRMFRKFITLLTT